MGQQPPAPIPQAAEDSLEGRPTAPDRCYARAGSRLPCTSPLSAKSPGGVVTHCRWFADTRSLNRLRRDCNPDGSIPSWTSHSNVPAGRSVAATIRLFPSSPGVHPRQGPTLTADTRPRIRTASSSNFQGSPRSGLRAAAERKDQERAPRPLCLRFRSILSLSQS